MLYRIIRSTLHEFCFFASHVRASPWHVQANTYIISHLQTGGIGSFFKGRVVIVGFVVVGVRGCVGLASARSRCPLCIAHFRYVIRQSLDDRLDISSSLILASTCAAVSRKRGTITLVLLRAIDFLTMNALPHALGTVGRSTSTSVGFAGMGPNRLGLTKQTTLEHWHSSGISK